MRQIAALIIGSLVAAPAVSWGAFRTCQDAWNYGRNTSELYAGQVFKRISCDPSQLDNAQHTLAEIGASEVLATQDSDAKKECFYDGYLSGLLERVSTEFGQCTDSAFQCVGQLAVAEYAAYLYVGMFQALSDPQALTKGTLSSIYDTSAKLSVAGVGECGAVSPDCSNTISSIIHGGLGPNAKDVQIGYIIEAVCGN
jgi:hypothetical protein